MHLRRRASKQGPSRLLGGKTRANRSMCGPPCSCALAGVLALGLVRLDDRILALPQPHDLKEDDTDEDEDAEIHRSGLPARLAGMVQAMGGVALPAQVRIRGLWGARIRLVLQVLDA